MDAPHIVVVDDELAILESLSRIFAREGYRVRVTDDGEEALGWLREEHVDVILADIMMPKMNGLTLLRAVKAYAPAVEVIMMTAFGTVENAVECMREGSYDFITKPLKRAIVVRCVERALERRALLRENRVLREAIGAPEAHELIGRSQAMRHVLELVAQAAPSTATLLLLGESGTGKELLARHAHALSPRRDGPFVAVNCAALPEGLLESELFGHERGAFSGAIVRHEGRFERAHGGTLLLDEIGETSPAVQVRLLRVLQEGEIERVGGHEVIAVDVRVIAATNRPLAEDVRAGHFREDLFYRLNVIGVEVPPLRERHGDVALLAQHFLEVFAAKNQKPVRGLSQAAQAALDAYAWPGNVRELENTMERAVVLCRSELIGVLDLPEVVAGAEAAPRPMTDGLFVPFGTPLEELERRLIRETLQRCHGDKKAAAKLLGIASRTIYRKLGEE